jgi:hypothetical protein
VNCSRGGLQRHRWGWHDETEAGSDIGKGADSRVTSRLGSHGF